MLRASLLALISAALFGASAPASKVLLRDLPPLELAGLLYLGAALGVAPRILLERSVRGRGRLDRANRGRLLGVVLLGGSLGPALLLFALRMSTAASVSLLLHLELAFTALLGAFVFREHLGARGRCGVLATLAAGVLVSAGGGRPGILAGLLTAMACACWAIDNHFSALLDAVTPARVTFWKGAVAGTTNLVLGVTLESTSLAPGSVAAALAVGAVCYGLSIALHIAAAQQLGAVRSQAVFATAPFLGAFFSWSLLGEPLGAAQVASTGLLLPGVVLLLLDRHAHLHSHVAADHVHAHRHDDGHHLHAHPGVPPSTVHSHRHGHEPLVHAHPHVPDLHHRHRHAPPRR